MPASLILMKGITTNAQVERSVGSEVVFTTLDSANIPAGNAPIGRPSGSGFGYSYESWLFLKVETPPDTGVNNFRFWSGGSDPDTGIYMYVGTAYASSTPSFSESTIATTNAIEYSAPDDSLLFCNNTLTGVNNRTTFLVMQLRVDSSATLGTLYNDNCVYHYSYDEW